MKQAYYSCEEHIETVLDMYIDDHELPPEIRKIEHTNSLFTACELCGDRSIYSGERMILHKIQKRYPQLWTIYMNNLFLKWG